MENENDGGGTRMGVDFSRGDTSSELHGLFTSTSLRGMPNEKDYHTLDKVFPFVAGLIDRATGLLEQAHNDEFAYYVIRPS